MIFWKACRGATPMTEDESADVCIIGTGAAGGILAYELAQKGMKVISVEQGGPIHKEYFTNEQNPQDIDNFGISAHMPWPVPLSDAYYYDNREASALYATDLDMSTSKKSERYFHNRQIFKVNGKQNLWGGVSLRMSERDFQGRRYDDSDFDWPIDYQTLEPHYAAVEQLITVCGNRDGLPNLPDGIFIPPKPLRPTDRILIEALKKIKKYSICAVHNRKAVETRREMSDACTSCGMCCYGCRASAVYKFSTRLLPKIADLPNYKILYDLKVIQLVRDATDNSIQEVLCINTQTKQLRAIRSKIFILAAGALETPRILFNSKDAAYDRGLANSSGLLGAYLQENVKVIVGSSFLNLLGNKEPYDVGYGDNLLIPRFIYNGEKFRGGFQGQFLHTILKRAHYLMTMGFLPSRAREPIARALFYSFAAIAFQGAPEILKTNRLSPSDEKDAYGIPKVDVFYEWSDGDKKMQKEMASVGALIFRKATGYFKATYVDEIPGNSIHYAGTCRMAANKNEGVVDENLQSFDHQNLYICDGSVFPTLSEKNLTLTIMALAHRLAGHLKS
jgi:glucose dehydrogenase